MSNEKANPNLSVPNVPAFEALGTKPSLILEGSEFQKLSAIAEATYSTGNIVLPQSLGVEFALKNFLKDSFNLDDFYGKWKAKNGREKAKLLVNRFLDNSSLSLGVQQAQMSRGRTAAFGIRTRVGGNGANYSRFYISSNMNYSTGGKLRTDEMLKAFEQNHWNDWNFNIAYAFAGTSKDSLATNLLSRSHHFWAQTAGGFAKKKNKAGKRNKNNKKENNKRQFVIGGFLGVPARDVYNTQGALGVRYYYGSNGIKFLVNFKGQWEEKSYPIYIFQMGLDVKISKILWFEFSVGIDRLPKVNLNQLLSSFQLQYRFNKPKS